MPTRAQTVGQIQVPGQKPQTVKIVGENRPVLTKDEQNAGLKWVDGRYESGDVRRYGAKIDGATDDGTAISNWIDVGLQGTELVHPGGTSLCSTWTQKSITSDLKITGSNGTKIQGDSSFDFIKPEGGSIDFDGIEFDTWNQVIQNGNADSGTTDKLRIRRCKFTNISSGPIDHERPLNRCWIEKNQFQTITGHCIRIGRNGDGDNSQQDFWQRMKIHGNVAVDINQTGSSDVSFCILYGKFADISHNYIEDVDTVSGEAWGIYTKVRYANVSNNEINDVASSSGAIYCINIKGSDRGSTSSPQGFSYVCSNNTILNTGSGVGIRSQNDDTLITGNLVEGCQIGIEGFSGTSFDNQSYSNNHIICPNTTSGTYGINLIGQVDGLSCTGNVVQSGEIGIRIAASTLACSDWIVDSNVIRDATSGISANSTVYITNISICNNIISGTTVDGIFIGEMTRLNILDNIVDVSSGDVIDFQGTDAVTKIHFRHIFEAQTTDNSVTNLLGVTLEDNTAIDATMNVVAMESDGSDRAKYGIGGLFYRDGAGATQQGSTINLFTAIESDATWGGPTFAVSSNDLLARIQGVTSQTINWRAKVELNSVS